MCIHIENVDRINPFTVVLLPQEVENMIIKTLTFAGIITQQKLTLLLLHNF